MRTKQLLARGVAVIVLAGAASASLAQPAGATRKVRIGGAEAAGFFKEATGFDSESEISR